MHKIQVVTYITQEQLLKNPSPLNSLFSTANSRALICSREIVKNIRNRTRLDTPKIHLAPLNASCLMQRRKNKITFLGFGFLTCQTKEVLCFGKVWCRLWVADYAFRNLKKVLLSVLNRPRHSFSRWKGVKDKFQNKWTHKQIRKTFMIKTLTRNRRKLPQYDKGHL